MILPDIPLTQVSYHPSAFLRALEFYDGILFLTTNRVGTFDVRLAYTQCYVGILCIDSVILQDAFISRIHVQLPYRDFTDEDRHKVWMTFVQKLTREQGKYMRISMDAKDYIKGKEAQATKWNGREIRNGAPHYAFD